VGNSSLWLVGKAENVPREMVSVVSPVAFERLFAIRLKVDSTSSSRGLQPALIKRVGQQRLTKTFYAINALN
jgi:hypothetical protein